MKYIKTFEGQKPIEDSKFKIDEEVIFIGRRYTNPYQSDSNRCEIGEKYKIYDVISSSIRYYYRVYDKDDNKIGYIIPEKMFLYEWEYNAKKYNL